jgi:phenylacetate-coenzyme A ligase PaaK-like adenylate-forming protein
VQKFQTISKKKKKKLKEKGVKNVAQVVKNSPCKQKALSLIAGTAKNKTQ